MMRLAIGIVNPSIDLLSSAEIHEIHPKFIFIVIIFVYNVWTSMYVRIVGVAVSIIVSYVNLIIVFGAVFGSTWLPLFILGIYWRCCFKRFICLDIVICLVAIMNDRSTFSGSWKSLNHQVNAVF